MHINRELSIIIVNYKKYELTERCIESILKNIGDINYEIVVLDNCSPNNSYKKLKEKYNSYKNISVIKNEENRGFGDGNNKAVKLSKYKNILLLNPDVVVLEDSIELMLNRLLQDNDIGIIGCKLLNQDLTLQYSCRSFISFKNFILARTPLNKLISKETLEKINSKYLMLDYNHTDEKEVDWLMGSCLMLKKEDFIQVGGFSREYFMYFEDVDLAYKLKQKGKKVLYYPKASMIHLHEQQSVKRLNKLSFIHFESMIKFYKKARLN